MQNNPYVRLETPVKNNPYVTIDHYYNRAKPLAPGVLQEGINAIKEVNMLAQSTDLKRQSLLQESQNIKNKIAGINAEIEKINAAVAENEKDKSNPNYSSNQSVAISQLQVNNTKIAELEQKELELQTQIGQLRVDQTEVEKSNLETTIAEISSGLTETTNKLVASSKKTLENVKNSIKEFEKDLIDAESDAIKKELETLKTKIAKDMTDLQASIEKKVQEAEEALKVKDVSKTETLEKEIQENITKLTKLGTDSEATLKEIKVRLEGKVEGSKFTVIPFDVGLKKEVGEIKDKKILDEIKALDALVISLEGNCLGYLTVTMVKEMKRIYKALKDKYPDQQFPEMKTSPWAPIIKDLKDVNKRLMVFRAYAPLFIAVDEIAKDLLKQLEESAWETFTGLFTGTPSSVGSQGAMLQQIAKELVEIYTRRSRNIGAVEKVDIAKIAAEYHKTKGFGRAGISAGISAGDLDAALRQIGQQEIPPAVVDYLNKYGNWTIRNMRLCKSPVQEYVMSALDIISTGDFNRAKRDLDIDRMFHTFIKLELENPADESGPSRPAIVEKNQRVYVGDDYGESVEYAMTIARPYGLTLQQLVQGGVTQLERLGLKPFNYDPVNNSCQVFIKAILDAQGMSTADTDAFLIQDVAELFRRINPFIKNIADGLVSVAQFGSILFEETLPSAKGEGRRRRKKSKPVIKKGKTAKPKNPYISHLLK